MVAKITAPVSLSNVLGYNFRKINDGAASVILTSNLSVDDNGEASLSSTLDDMQSRLPSGVRTKKPVFHCSINPHPDDVLTTNQLRNIAAEYMERMGYGNQPYIVFKHNDIAREHIHIVSLRVDTHGKKLPHAFEGRRSKNITNDLEIKYDLVPSGNNKKKIEDKVKSAINIADINQGYIGSQIANVVHSVMKNYAFQSIGEMNLILSQYNVIAEEVKKEYKGKLYNGLVYAISDNDGNKLTTPLHASKIGRGTGYSAVSTHFEKSNLIVKEKAPILRNLIVDTMKSSPNKEEFITEMKNHNVDVVIRQNEQGRIYGISFVSDELCIASNGSRLGKGYSANVFNDYFTTGNNPFLKYPQLQSDVVMSPIDTLSESAAKTTPETEEEQFYEEFTQDDSLPISVHGIDYKEMAFQRKLRFKHGRLKINRKRRF